MKGFEVIAGERETVRFWENKIEVHPELADALYPRRNRYMPHEPTAKQKVYLLLQCKEALYGGAGGGGKSDALLMAALQYVDCPDYRALLMRRTIPDLMLPKSLIPRSKEWLRGTDARWHQGYLTWTFPSGAVLQFGHMESEKDKERYRSAEFQFIGFDEMTQFTRTQYTFMFSRLRRLRGSMIPSRIRGATNPGGIGHAWVKARFFLGGVDERQVRENMAARLERGRVFVPATVWDNPHIDQEDYADSLSELDAVLRAQILNGDWSVREGGSWFDRENFHLIDFMPPDHRSFMTVLFVDLASTERNKATNEPDWTRMMHYSIDLNTRREYIRGVWGLQGSPGQVQRMLVKRARILGNEVPIVIEQEPGSSGAYTIFHFQELDALRSFMVLAEQTTGNKQIRARPCSTAAQQGKVFVLRGPWNGPFFDEVEAFPEGPHDDQVDCWSGARKKCLHGLPWSKWG